MKPTLVIGDVHGHYDRLESLLVQEGILGEPNGEFHRPRVNFDVEVIQLGDLGHFASNGSRTGDQFVYEAVRDQGWLDYVLWGNHDRYVVDSHHNYTNCEKPSDTTRRAMLDVADRMRFAMCRHGFLLTHAGLAKAFRYQGVPGLDKWDVSAVAEWLNTVPASLPTTDPNRGIIDNVSVYRGGRAKVGGILWRDIKESLHPIPQVFGHSVRNRPTAYWTKDLHTGEKKMVKSYCVDVGRPDNGYLAGIWLPEQRIVEFKDPREYVHPSARYYGKTK